MSDGEIPESEVQIMFIHLTTEQQAVSKSVISIHCTYSATV